MGQCAQPMGLLGVEMGEITCGLIGRDCGVTALAGASTGRFARPLSHTVVKQELSCSGGGDMSESSGRTNSDTTQRKQLLDPHGTPLPSRLTWRQRWNAISRRTRIALMSVLAVIAASATLLTNLQRYRNTSHPCAPPSVPPIVVEITNSSKTPVAVAARGNFYSWLPGPGAGHTIGKYEFRNLGGAPLESGDFTVGPAARARLLAHILNQNLYGRVLKEADCDIAFMVRKANGGHRTTTDLPFTQEAINKYCATVDIGAD